MMGYYVLLAGAGAILKMLLHAIKKDGTAKLLESILGVILCFSFLNSFCYFSFPKIRFQPKNDEAYFQNIEEKSMKNILGIAEKELEATLSEEAKLIYGVSPMECSVSIEKDTLKISKICFSFSTANLLFSAFEVKRYFEEKYGAVTIVKMV